MHSIKTVKTERSMITFWWHSSGNGEGVKYEIKTRENVCRRNMKYSLLLAIYVKCIAFAYGMNGAYDCLGLFSKFSTSFMYLHMV